MAAQVRLGGVNRYADGAKVKPVLAAFAPPPDPAAIERILSLTLKLELLWLVLAPLGLVGFALVPAVR
jgi:adenosylcobinamide-phosphate synthase